MTVCRVCNKHAAVGLEVTGFQAQDYKVTSLDVENRRLSFQRSDRQTDLSTALEANESVRGGGNDRLFFHDRVSAARRPNKSKITKGVEL